MKKPQPKTKGPFDATVAFNKQLTEGFCRLGLEFTGPGAKAFADTTPGRFAQFDLTKVRLPDSDAIPPKLKDLATRQILLRRPFSFAKITTQADKTTVEVVYCVLGPATLRMTTLAKGDSISVLGPLGNGFTIPQDKSLALLVAGGMGSPPLEHLAQVLTASHPSIKPLAFAGAKTADDLPFEKQAEKITAQPGRWLAEFAQYDVQSLVATDDGSAGFKGTVTYLLSHWLDNNPHDPAQTIIYACGPKPMLASVAALADQKNIDCLVSTEEMMACGIGLCQSCAVKWKSPTGEETYKLCCKDGPVFNAKQVVF